MILICLASKAEWMVVLFAAMWNTGVILRGLYVGKLGKVCMCECVRAPVFVYTFSRICNPGYELNINF